MKTDEKGEMLASPEKADEIFKSYSIVYTEKDVSQEKGTKI